MRRTARELLGDLPLPLRHAVVGAVLLGVLGAIAGTVLGLRTYGPTAWAAAFEVGVPASCVGFVIGLASGSLARAASARSGRTRSAGRR